MELRFRLFRSACDLWGFRSDVRRGLECFFVVMLVTLVAEVSIGSDKIAPKKPASKQGNPANQGAKKSAVEPKNEVAATQPENVDYFLRFAGPHGIVIPNSAADISWTHPVTIEIWCRLNHVQSFKEFNGYKRIVQVFGTPWEMSEEMLNLSGLSSASASERMSLRQQATAVGQFRPIEGPVEKLHWTLGIERDGKSYSAGVHPNRGGGASGHSIKIPANWVHIALQGDAFKKTGMLVFVNGARCSTFHFSDEPQEVMKRAPASNLILGGVESRGEAPNFYGDLCAVRVSETARYVDGFTPPARFLQDADTTLLLDFSKPTNGTIQDLCVKNRVGQIFGATWFDSKTEKVVKNLTMAGNSDAAKYGGIGKKSPKVKSSAKSAPPEKAVEKLPE